jgi:hypothetical protein
MKKSIAAMMLLSTSLSYSASYVAIASGIAVTNNAQNNQNAQKSQIVIENELHDLEAKALNVLPDGVFLCRASEGERKGYYGSLHNKCIFWDNDRGYFDLSLQEVYKTFLPNKKILNVIYIRDLDNNYFEIYFSEELKND